MGICSSCDSSSVSTAKLILQDGRLQEFSYPVRVSYVLQKADPGSFICNSDEMDFDRVVTPISADEELQPGQIYFSLPLSRLKHRLQPEEMAALAVKASYALAKSGGGDKCGCRRKSFSLSMFSAVKNHAKPSKRVSDVGEVAEDGGVGMGRRRNNGGGVGGKRRNFTARLSAIPE